MARRYPARSACDRLAHGPESNAVRAAPTAREMSPAWASATVRKTSSLVESITLMVLSDDGLTHSPPMKN